MPKIRVTAVATVERLIEAEHEKGACDTLAGPDGTGSGEDLTNEGQTWSVIQVDPTTIVVGDGPTLSIPQPDIDGLTRSIIPE